LLNLFNNYFSLIRLPNCLSAVSNVLAGYFIIADIYQTKEIIALAIISFCLYSAGIILNDLIDFDFDLKYNAKRILPSKKISLGSAKLLFFLNIITSLTLSLILGVDTFTITLMLIVTIVIYDYLAKKKPISSSFFMGLCRGLNWILGFSIYLDKTSNFIHIPIIISLYIIGLTIASKFEHKSVAIHKSIIIGLVMIVPIDIFWVCYYKGVLISMPLFIIFLSILILKKQYKMS